MKQRLARQGYTLLVHALIPFALLRLAWLGLKLPGYRERWRERFGYIAWPATNERPLWLHAVSVGEVQATAPLIRHLLEQCPEMPLLVTTTTPTGAATVARLFGDRVSHRYVPYDLPGAIDRFIDRCRPRALILVETELWPNLIAGCARRGVPTALVNARLSPRSQAGYQRIPALVRPMLESLEVIAAQTGADAARLRQLGARESGVQVTGSLKFDIRHSAGTREQGEALRHRLGLDRSRWIAASTHAGEEEVVLEIQQRLMRHLPGVQLLLAPRHPERSGEVVNLAQRMGLKLVRHSSGEPAGEADVFLIDLLGQLPACYAASDVAFVGGSLVPVGGHNVLEPADLGLPVLFGPQVFNFEHICRELLRVGGAHQVRDAQGLESEVDRLLRDASARDRMGRQARELVEANRGSVDRVLALIEPLIS